MPEEPRFPTAIVAAWLAGIADLATLAWLWTSSAPLVLKAGVTAVLGLGLWTILVFYAGQRRQWRASRERYPVEEPIRIFDPASYGTTENRERVRKRGTT